MKKIIVTVKIENKKESFDIEMAADSIAAKILPVLCKSRNLGNEKDYIIFAAPPGRLLEPAETFEEAGVWDGAVLTLKRVK